jgi:amino-acid N-acetyltransferase
VLGTTQHTELDVPRKAHDGVVILYPFGRVALRRAQPHDAPAIHALLETWVRAGSLLPRTLGQVYRSIRDFVVAVEADTIVGCAALRVYSGKLGEVAALAVAREWHGRGVGRRIVEALVEEANGLGMEQVFALTLEAGFFQRLGFRTTPIADFPEKIAQDCRTCAKRNACVEIAVVRDLVVPDD